MQNTANHRKSIFKRVIHYIFRWIQFRYLRKRVKLASVFDGEHKKNPKQILAIKMVKLVASKVDSEILITPLSNKYYIRNGDIFIILECNMISIINTVYHYDIYINESIKSNLTSYLSRIVEHRRSKMEDEMRAKVQKSLQHILDSALFKFNK